MNAVIYARYSSDTQREESIEGQIRECTEFAAHNGYTIVGTYIDRALSARTADRPQFKQMIADSARGIFDVVLVCKLDRFSRDRYDSAHYKHALKMNGVRVVSAKENISDGPEGIILESMLEGYAEYYSAELSQKIHRGQHENALKCKNNGGRVPVGYRVDKETGVLAIDPETAPLVKEIYDRYSRGIRICQIVKDLKNRGIKTNYGKNFTISGVSLILKNRKYIGEYKYGDVVIPDGIPAIIDTDLFERVQLRMARNEKAPGWASAKEEYLLSTKLFCGDCGRMMVGESGKGNKGIVYHYYKCSGAKRKKGCHRKAVKKNWIERLVVYVTVTQVLSENTIDRIADTIVKMQDKEDPMLPVLRQQIKDCEKSIENMVNAIQAGIITAATKTRLEELEQQREDLAVTLMQTELSHPRYTKEQVVTWISQFKYGNFNDPEYQKEIIDIFVNSVYIYDDRIVFTYNFKDGTETLTKQQIDAVLSSDLVNFSPPNSNCPNFFPIGKGQGPPPKNPRITGRSF